MTWGYDRRRDMMTGHDFPGVVGSGIVAWELDELELGARVAMEIDDPDGDQWWWVLHAEEIKAELAQGEPTEDWMPMTTVESRSTRAWRWAAVAFLAMATATAMTAVGTHDPVWLLASALFFASFMLAALWGRSE